MKVLDWGEDGVSSVAEIAALRASFRQEVAVWHRLDHPNVAKVKYLLHVVYGITVSQTGQTIHFYCDYSNTEGFDSLHLVLPLFFMVIFSC